MSKTAKKEKLQESKEEPNFHLKPGDLVECSMKGCEGRQFVVKSVHQASNCYSKHLVVAYLKDEPDREIKGVVIDSVNYGVDSTYFRKI